MRMPLDELVQYWRGKEEEDVVVYLSIYTH